MYCNRIGCLGQSAHRDSSYNYLCDECLKELKHFERIERVKIKKFLASDKSGSKYTLASTDFKPYT